MDTNAANNAHSRSQRRFLHDCTVLSLLCLNARSDRQLEIVEQPMPRACLQEMAELRQALRGRALLMADESCWEPTESAELIKEQSVDVFSVYVHESGKCSRPVEPTRVACANRSFCRTPPC